MRCWRIILLTAAIQIVLLVSGCVPHKIVRSKLSHPQEKKAGQQGIYHRVERHQTLYRICKTYGVDINEVVSLNEIADQSNIRAGQRIFIPGAKEVLKVDIYIDDVVAESGQKEKEREREREKIAHKAMNFLWPVEGKFGDLFEETESKRHQGIDILSPLGTPVKASGSGVVLYSGNSIRGYGNLIILRHSEEFITVYAHNQVNLVEEGIWVEKGQIIGKVGQTGKASGPHLHFEIRVNNKAVDPLPFLK